MIVFAWVLAGAFILSMVLAPLGIGRERTVGNVVMNILYHIAILIFIGIFLAVHYLGSP